MLKRMLEKEELNGWKWLKRRHGITGIDEGFCLKLNHWTIGDTRLNEKDEDIQAVPYFDW